MCYKFNLKTTFYYVVFYLIENIVKATNKFDCFKILTPVWQENIALLKKQSDFDKNQNLQSKFQCFVPL